MKICLDPGHGGEDSGAVGPGGLHESDAALAISMYVRRGLLDQGDDVICTRDADDFVSLTGRCELANAQGADQFISIHCNAFTDPDVEGYEVWTSRGVTDADAIAQRLFDSIGGAFPKLRPRMDITDGDSDFEKGFAVLVGTSMPAVLIECAFISNLIEERWLGDVGWKMRMAGAIVSGLRR
jgi:N-acetylmuramoyl-L-alanine amidase